MPSYNGLEFGYLHEVINHAKSYVEGRVHTNGMENFWSLLKRGLNGTYVSVEPFHLFRYVDEQAFRFNHRKPMRPIIQWPIGCMKLAKCASAPACNDLL